MEASKPELGPWGLLVLAGFGLVALGRLVFLMAHFDDVDGADRAPLLFGVAGAIVLSSGLVGAGLFLRAITLPIRVALILGGSLLLLTDTSGVYGVLSSVF